MSAHRPITCLAALATAVTLAACSSAATGSSGPATSGPAGDPQSGGPTSNSAGIATAQALVEKYSAPPASLGITTPVPGPIPTGKRIDVLDCGSPSCAAQVTAFKRAADALGWSVTDINQGTTPDTVNKAWQQVERNLPDAVVTSSQPASVYQGGLDYMASHNVPVVDCCSDNTPTGALRLSADGLQSIELEAKLMAAKMIVDSNGSGKAVFISTPAFPSLVALEKDFNNFLKENCAGCSDDSLPIAATDIASPAVPTKIVGFLRSHSDTKYVIAGFDDELIGVPAALSQANLDSVKMIGEDPSTTTLPYIKSGAELASVTYPLAEYEWLLADALARVFVGAPVTPDQVVLPLQLIDKAAVGSASAPPEIPDYEGQFKKLWGKA